MEPQGKELTMGSDPEEKVCLSSDTGGFQGTLEAGADANSSSAACSATEAHSPGQD